MRLKKALIDLAFAVLKAGDQLESEGKLQLTWGNNKLHPNASGDSALQHALSLLPGRSRPPAEECRAGFLPEDGTAILKDCWKIAVVELCVKVGWKSC